MSNPLEEVIDDRHTDKLYAPRMEALFHPSPDGSPSLSGQLSFFTQKWHFRDGQVFSQSDGPVIRHQFDALMSRRWELPDGSSLHTVEVLLLMERIFTTLALEHGNTPALPMITEGIENSNLDYQRRDNPDSLRTEDAGDAGQLYPSAD